jgi:hypothetical protein
MSLASTPDRRCKTAAFVLHIVFFPPKLPEWGSGPPASPWLRFKYHVSYRPHCMPALLHKWYCDVSACEQRLSRQDGSYTSDSRGEWHAEARCERHCARAGTMLSQKALMGTVTMYIWSSRCRLMPSHHVASWPEIWCGMRLKDTPRSGEAGESRCWAEVHCCVMLRNVMHRALRWGLKFAAKFSAGVGVC